MTSHYIIYDELQYVVVVSTAAIIVSVFAAVGSGNGDEWQNLDLFH
jgi:hypothetical protein